MGYSEAAEAGKKINGKNWRAKISGLGEINSELRAAIEEENATKIETSLRKVGQLFRPYLDASNLVKSEGFKYTARPGELEAVEWFEEETATYEIEQGTLHEFVEEYDYRLNELYDFCDFNRIWVKPGGWD